MSGGEEHRVVGEQLGWQESSGAFSPILAQSIYRAWKGYEFMSNVRLLWKGSKDE